MIFMYKTLLIFLFYLCIYRIVDFQCEAFLLHDIVWSGAEFLVPSCYALLNPWGRCVCSSGPSQIHRCRGTDAPWPIDSSYRYQLRLSPYPLVLHRICFIQITLFYRIGCLWFVFLKDLEHIWPCLGPGLSALLHSSFPLFDWLQLGLIPLVAPPVSVLNFFSRPEIELFIRFGFPDFFLFSSTPSPPQVWHGKVL